MSGSGVKNDSDWIYFNASLAKVEQMMDAEFFYFTQDANKSQTKRIWTLKCSVLVNVLDHIAMIKPTSQMKPERSTSFKAAHFGTTDRRTEVPAVPSALNVTAGNTTITPDSLQALYSMNDY